MTIAAIITGGLGLPSALMLTLGLSSATVLQTSATEPVTLAEARLAARIDAQDDELDDHIETLISAARRLAEQQTGRSYVRKTVRYQLAEWPSVAERFPVHEPAAVAVSYWDGATWATLSSAAFVFFAAEAGTGVAPALGTAWPQLGQVAGGPRVRFDFTVGPADPPATVDACVKVFIKAVVAYWHDNPAAADGGDVPRRLLGLLDPERLWF